MRVGEWVWVSGCGCQCVRASYKILHAPTYTKGDHLLCSMLEILLRMFDVTLTASKYLSTSMVPVLLFCKSHTFTHSDQVVEVRRTQTFKSQLAPTGTKGTIVPAEVYRVHTHIWEHVRARARTNPNISTHGRTHTQVHMESSGGYVLLAASAVLGGVIASAATAAILARK